MQRKGNNDQGSNKDGVSDVVVSHSLVSHARKKCEKNINNKNGKKIPNSIRREEYKKTRKIRRN